MIQVGDPLPNATFTVMTAEGPSRKPPTRFSRAGRSSCSPCRVPSPRPATKSLAGFRDKFDAIKAKGVDTIAVTGVNDVFVMNAWAEATGAKDKIEFLADGSGHFAKAIGLSVDLGERGLGLRSQRYSMLVEDGVVSKLNVEQAPGKADLSSAETMLGQL